MRARLRSALFVLIAGVTLFAGVAPAFAAEGGEPSPDASAGDAAAGDAAEAAPAEEPAGEEAADEAEAAAEEAAEGPAEESEADESAEEPAVEESGDAEAPAESESSAASRPAAEASVVTPKANPGSTTSNGQTVNIVINTPKPGDTIKPGDTVTVTGQASIGLLGANVNVAYVIDVSGSTGNPAGDCTGDTVPNNILECEKAAALALNSQFAAIPGVQAGVVDFDHVGSVQQGLVPASDPAVAAAINALAVSGGTSFDAGLGSMNDLFSTAAPGSQNIAYFMSDGHGSLTPGPGSALQAAVDAGVQVNTFSIGTNAEGCGDTSGLKIIADATGGVCIEVDDISQILSVIDDLKPAGIDKVEISVNGGPPVEAELDLLGNFSIEVTGFVVGENTITATAVSTDGTKAVAEITVSGGQEAQALPAVLVASQDTSSDETLPATGSDTTRSLTAVGIGLLLAGIALVAISRQREVPYLAQFHD